MHPKPHESPHDQPKQEHPTKKHPAHIKQEIANTLQNDEWHKHPGGG